jgi:hypothetical protein
MIQDVIMIDRNLLVLNEITISDFFFMSSLHGNSYEENKAMIGYVNHEELQTKGFIKILGEDYFILREKGRALFIDTKNNFYRFLNAFPIKTPSGRYLSPKNLEGVAVNKIKDRFNRLFKNNVFHEDLAIRVLEAEVAWRKKTGQMEFMNACEAWLNMANYEKFEYLLEESENESKREDYNTM